MNIIRGFWHWIYCRRFEVKFWVPYMARFGNMHDKEFSVTCARCNYRKCVMGQWVLDRME